MTDKEYTLQCDDRVMCREGMMCIAPMTEGGAFECHVHTLEEFEALEYKCDLQYAPQMRRKTQINRGGGVRMIDDNRVISFEYYNELGRKMHEIIRRGNIRKAYIEAGSGKEIRVVEHCDNKGSCRTFSLYYSEEGNAWASMKSLAKALTDDGGLWTIRGEKCHG